MKYTKSVAFERTHIDLIEKLMESNRKTFSFTVTMIIKQWIDMRTDLLRKREKDILNTNPKVIKQ